MVDTTDAAESKYVTPDIVKSSVSKRLVILSEGSYEKTDYGTKLTLPCEIDGKLKIFRPNQDTVRNLQEYGVDSKQWVGKIVKLMVQSVKGKDCVIGYALPVDLAVAKQVLTPGT